MAAWPAERLDAYLAGPLPSATANSVTDPARIRERLSRIRRDGYAWTDQELDLEVNGLAAPLVDVAGTTLAVATLYGPSYRFAEQLDPQLGRTFASFVRERAGMLGG
jgi:DNA-binding IclR family transcriptional regulator